MLSRFRLLMIWIVICGTVNAMDLREAASSGNVERVKQLIREGVPTNEPDRAGWTPLHSATLENHEDVVNILLDSGITHQIKNCKGYTPTDFAYSSNFSEQTIHRLKQLPIKYFESLGGNKYDFDRDIPNVFLSGITGPISHCQTHTLTSITNENLSLVAEVFQTQAGFTHAMDKKPIVATFGCGPCVAIGGYDSVNHVAFIVHVTLADEVRKCGGMIASHIRSLMRKPLTSANPIAIHLRSGYLGMSEDLIAAIKTWMEQFHDLPMKIASEDTLGFLGPKSLSIDSRTGIVSDYSPRKGRDRLELESMALSSILSAYDPHIGIAYKASLP